MSQWKNKIDPVSFLEFENQLPVDTYTFWKINWWEVVRYQIWNNSGEGVGEASQNQLTRGRRLASFAKTLVNQHLRIKRCDLLVLNHPRRQMVDGQLVDKYTDCIVSDLSKCGIMVGVLESHSEAAFYKTCRFSFNIFTLKSLIKIFFFPILPLLFARAFFSVRQVQNAVDKVVGFDSIALRTPRISLILYEFICQFVAGCIVVFFSRAKGFILVPGPGNEGYIQAAKLFGITIFELQHGSPVFPKVNYCFPRKLVRRYRPHYFLMSGSRSLIATVSGWEKVRFFSLGSPYLTMVKEAVKHRVHEYDILVIGQDAVDEHLYQLLVDARGSGIEFRALVRPHPSASSQTFWSSVIVEDGFSISDPKFNDLATDIANCRKVIGGFSTSLYEAEFLGKDVGVIGLENLEFVSEKVDTGSWSVISVDNFANWLAGEDTAATVSEEDICLYDKESFYSLISKTLQPGPNYHEK